MLSFICIKIYELNTMKTWLEMWNIIEEKKEKKKYPQLWTQYNEDLIRNVKYYWRKERKKEIPTVVYL